MKTEFLSDEVKIHRISILGGEYDSESNLSLDDQLLACESIAESTPVNPDDWDGRTILGLREKSSGIGYAYVRGCDYGGCKCNAVAELFQDKKVIIDQLNTCRSRVTPIVQIASLLDDLFSDYPPNKPEYWFNVARFYCPRVIYRVLVDLRKLSSPGHVTVRNPAAYFTFLLKKRKKRKNVA